MEFTLVWFFSHQVKLPSLASVNLLPSPAMCTRKHAQHRLRLNCAIFLGSKSEENTDPSHQSNVISCQLQDHLRFILPAGLHSCDSLTQILFQRVQGPKEVIHWWCFGGISVRPFKNQCGKWILGEFSFTFATTPFIANSVAPYNQILNDIAIVWNCFQTSHLASPGFRQCQLWKLAVSQYYSPRSNHPLLNCWILLACGLFKLWKLAHCPWHISSNAAEYPGL